MEKKIGWHRYVLVIWVIYSSRSTFLALFAIFWPSYGGPKKFLNGGLFLYMTLKYHGEKNWVASQSAVYMGYIFIQIYFFGPFGYFWPSYGWPKKFMDGGLCLFMTVEYHGEKIWVAPPSAGHMGHVC